MCRLPRRLPWTCPQPLLTVSLQSYHPVLAVLAGATKPLSGRHIAHHTGIADNTALTTLDCLASTGVVSRLTCSNVTLHLLDYLHVAGEAVLELTRLPDRLAERPATAVAAWDPQPPRSRCGWRVPNNSTPTAMRCS
jgi:hypothetical protein